MARKGQKFKTYTAEFRKNTVKEIEQISLTYVAQKYKVNIKILNSWQINFKKGILNTPKGPKEPFGKKDLNYYKVRYELGVLYDEPAKNNSCEIVFCRFIVQGAYLLYIFVQHT